MAIPLVQSRRVFTIAFINKFDELTKLEAPTFFSSFFKEEVYATLGTALKARRGKELIAVDVVRGSKGHYNQATKFTEKMLIPPYFLEKLSITAMQIYDRPFEAADGSVDVPEVQMMAENAANEIYAIMQMILRAKEKQAAEVFETGIVELEADNNIDFKRKASMMEVLAGADLWSSTSADIMKRYEIAGQKLRRTGKVMGGQRVYSVMGMEAWQAFRNNENIKDGENFITTNTLNLSPRMKNATGGSFMGTLKAGGYEFDIWVYDEVYELEDGTEVAYWDSKTVVWIPESFKGEMSNCGVPKLPEWVKQSPAASRVMSGRSSMSKGVYLSDYVDQENEEWVARLKAAVVAQPITVDKIYTAKVIA